MLSIYNRFHIDSFKVSKIKIYISMLLNNEKLTENFHKLWFRAEFYSLTLWWCIDSNLIHPDKSSRSIWCAFWERHTFKKTTSWSKMTADRIIELLQYSSKYWHHKCLRRKLFWKPKKKQLSLFLDLGKTCIVFWWMLRCYVQEFPLVTSKNPFNGQCELQVVVQFSSN